MIITCPDCATRYDVDDERFSPSGRSVRCSSCGESWFVPAPELLDVEPLDKKPSKRHAPKRQDEDKKKEDYEEDDLPARPRMKVGVPDEEDEGREIRKEPKRDRRDWRDEEDDDRETSRSSRRNRDDRRSDYVDADDTDDDDDSLFDTPSSRKSRDEDEDDEPAEKGWRKGRQFIVEDDDEEEDRRPFFSGKRKNKADERESLRFADEDSDKEDDDGYNAAYVVDADWEDVEDGDGDRSRGFGRKIRAERRRATALARMEDVRPLDPADLDEEFFAALRVTPRELERAIRKARRRAEAREKNRLTPLRVLGWSAWLAVIAGVVYGAFVYRDEVVKLAPKAADAYAVIGIDANPYGLSIENVRHRLAMSTGGPTIEITGDLRNDTDSAVTAPLLQAEALGARGELLARWTFSANRLDVAEGETVEFITRAPAPDGVAEVALSFAPEKSVLESLMPNKDD